MYTLLQPCRASALMHAGYAIYGWAFQGEIAYCGFQVPYRDGDIMIERLPDGAYNVWSDFLT